MSTPALPKLLLTVEEAAECLGLGRTTTYALIKSGDLVTVQVGRLRRVRFADIEAYIHRLSDTARAA